MNNENIEVDKKELHKQYTEDIKKNERWVEVNILVGKENSIAMPTLEIHNASIREVAIMISALRELIDNICKTYPEAKAFADFCIKSESDGFEKM